MRKRRLRKGRVLFLTVCLTTLVGAIIHLIHTDAKVQNMAVHKKQIHRQVKAAHETNKQHTVKPKVSEQPLQTGNQHTKENMQVPPDQKVIALTFDDGPKKGTTDIVLNALEKYHAHATFFVLGSMAEKHPELVRRIADAGQEIGSHSWSHPQLTKLSDAAIQYQIDHTNTVIEQITGKKPALIRPPYGSVDAHVRKYLGNMQVVLWNIDPEDWKYRDSDYVVQAVMRHAADGRTILMHDIYQTSANAAVEVMRQLTAEGYKIVSVSELQEIQEQRAAASKHD